MLNATLCNVILFVFGKKYQFNLPNPTVERFELQEWFIFKMVLFGNNKKEKGIPLGTDLFFNFCRSV